MKKYLLIVALLTAVPALAGELEDKRKDLVIVQSQIREELANLRAAQTEINRIKAIGPGLEAQAAALEKEIKTLEEKQKKK